MSDDRDADDLEQRVDELEETVRKMLPNRRDVLKGGAAAAAVGAAGLVGRESVEPARAAQGDQGLGTPTDPWPATYTEYLGGGNADLHVDAQTVETERANNTYRPAPGVLQSVLQNDVSAGDRVVLHSGKNYDPGSETTVPADVELYGNGATFVPTSDYDVLLVDSGATAREIIVDYTNVTSTSRAVRVSTADSTNGYDSTQGAQFDIGVAVFGNNNSETAAEIKTNDNGIIGGQCDVVAEACNIGIRCESTTSPGFIDAVHGNIEIADCGKGIYHTGAAVTCLANFRGYIFPNSTVSQQAIHNDAGDAKSVTLFGHIYGAGDFTDVAIKGQEIKVLDLTGVPPNPSDMDGSAGQVVESLERNGNKRLLTQQGRGYQVSEIDSGNNQDITWCAEDLSGTGQAKLTINGNPYFEVRDDGFTNLKGNKLRGDGAESITIIQHAYGLDELHKSSDPTTSDLENGATAFYQSDGSSGVTGSDGDYVRAYNDGGTIKTEVVSALADLS